MLSKEDMGNKLKELLADIDPRDNAAMDEAIRKSLSFLTENYNKFDAVAKELIDQMTDSLLAKAKENIDKMDDGFQKRQGERILKMASGSHQDSKILVQVLERRPDKKLEILDDTRETFIKGLQTILDLLLDVREKRQQGIVGFSKISLFYLCVDELLAAYHLTQHAFVNQAYSHIRSIFENLDKIGLFHQQPEWAEIWVSDKPEDRKKVRKELIPSKVRKKLGRKGYDPIYSMFSEMGPHGTFRGIQSRTARKINDSDEIPTIHFWIAGCPFEHNYVWLCSFLSYAVVHILLKIIYVYSEYLHDEELEKILDDTATEFEIFIKKHYVEWAKREGLETEPLEQDIEKLRGLRALLNRGI
ncbi:MAG: hypothetical protein NT096_12335 [Proteobacteria bacterium]|nr:hypothetical protein [Pseudomonadota bacterium]